MPTRAGDAVVTRPCGSEIRSLSPRARGRQGMLIVLVAGVMGIGCGGSGLPDPDLGTARRDPGSLEAAALARQVEVLRTAYGVPHIYADNFRAMGYALGYLQLEDYGERVPRSLMAARGELARHEGRAALDADFANLPHYQRAVTMYPLLEADTRDVYEGYATGVNRYVAEHPFEFPSWMEPTFTGYDVAALYVYGPSAGELRRWRARLGDAAVAASDAPSEPETIEEADPIEAGSSAWALAPSRTVSGVPILLRNPHLSWEAGYWEAHVVVPDRIDFYGDFRIGAPLGIVGGFNRRLGFATTNNDVDNTIVYALSLDPSAPDHYLLDGASVPIGRDVLMRDVRDGDDLQVETRERLATDIGPVLMRDADTIYVVRSPLDQEFRGGEQFLKLMQARTLDEWFAAMRLRAHPQSNFIYADADGNILYLWNAAIPRLPHPPAPLAAVPVTRSDEVWSELHEIDELPQLLNPSGGYVRNENDGPWLTTLRQPLDPSAYPDYFEGSGLSLRSQHALTLIDGDDRLSLEAVTRLARSERMLLADRVKADLMGAARAALDGARLVAGDPDDDTSLRSALDGVAQWDNTVAPDSRGGVLFEAWWRLYVKALAQDGDDDTIDPFAEPWNEREPLATPRGLARPDIAARVFADAVRETVTRHGTWDVAWGDVHRVRRGAVDVAVGGCAGALGCYRVLNFRSEEDGRRRAVGGEAWTLAVEFTSPPRAYSVLAYGQSARADSPHHDDQAAMFARGEFKRVAYTREDVEGQIERRYRPGLD